MRDRISRYPNRIGLTDENGVKKYYTLSREDEPIEEGTKLNKANLLSDDTSALLGLGDNPTVNDAINQVFKVGDVKTTVRNDLSDSWLLCNGALINGDDYPELKDMLLAEYASMIDESITGRGGIRINDNLFVVHAPTKMLEYYDGMVFVIGQNTIYFIDLQAENPVWYADSSFTGCTFSRPYVVNGKLFVCGRYSPSSSNTYPCAIEITINDDRKSIGGLIHNTYKGYNGSAQVNYTTIDDVCTNLFYDESNGVYIALNTTYASGSYTYTTYYLYSYDLVTWYFDRSHYVTQSYADYPKYFYSQSKHMLYGVGSANSTSTFRVDMSLDAILARNTNGTQHSFLSQKGAVVGEIVEHGDYFYFLLSIGGTACNLYKTDGSSWTTVADTPSTFNETYTRLSNHNIDGALFIFDNSAMVYKVQENDEQIDSYKSMRSIRVAEKFQVNYGIQDILLVPNSSYSAICYTASSTTTSSLAVQICNKGVALPVITVDNAYAYIRAK